MEKKSDADVENPLQIYHNFGAMVEPGKLAIGVCADTSTRYGIHLGIRFERADNVRGFLVL